MQNSSSQKKKSSASRGGDDQQDAIEDIYQKKTQLEHILLRPDTYIGSVEMYQQELWVYDKETEKIVFKRVSYVPGLYKIFGK
jgi:DNA topoisomerase-2